MPYPLSYGVWWAREDSNLRVGCLVYSQVQSPLVPHALGWLLRRHIVPWHGGAPLAIVSDEDVADLVIRALEARARGAFNASSDNLLTSQDISEQFEMTALWIPNFLIFGYRVLDR